MNNTTDLKSVYDPSQDTFASFISENKLYETAPLEELHRLPGQNVVALAFDGNKILDKACENVQRKEPMSIYTTATPFEVYTIIDEFCGGIAEQLTKYCSEMQTPTIFKNVFVFNGCGFVPLREPNPTAPRQPSDRIAQLSCTTVNDSVYKVEKEFQKEAANRFVIEPDVESLIVRRFHEFCPDTFRAPYIAWSQISAFLSDDNRYISEIYGSLELLAFPGVERVITEIDLNKKLMTYVSKQKVVEKLQELFANFTFNELADIILLTSKNRYFKINALTIGFLEFCKIAVETNTEHWIEDFVNNYYGNSSISPFLYRNLSALDAPVIIKDGSCIFLSNLYNMEVRSNVKLFLGQRLPSEFYYYLMGGPVMTESIATVSQRIFADDWPLVDSDAFRRIAEVLMPLRVQIAYQYFSVLKFDDGLSWLRHYVLFKNETSEDKRLSQIKKPPEIKLAYWDIKPESLMKEQTDNVYFKDVLQLAECAVTEKKIYESIDYTLSAILLRSLDLLGYFTHETNNGEKSSESVFCKALKHFDCGTLSEYGVLAIELFRTGALHDGDIKTAKSGYANRYTRGLRLAARLLSIIPINLNEPWKGPFSVEIAAFGTLSRMYSRTYRMLTEVNATLLFYDKAVNIPLDQLDRVIEKLPFALPTEFSAGFLMMYILSNPNDTMDNLKLVFPEMMCMEEDLSTLFWFWTMALCAFMEIMEQENAVVLQYLPLLEAHKLLSDACKRLQFGLWQQVYEPIETNEKFKQFTISYKLKMQALEKHINNGGHMYHSINNNNNNNTNINNNNNNFHHHQEHHMNGNNYNTNNNNNNNNVNAYSQMNNINNINAMNNMNGMDGMNEMNQMNNINPMHNINYMGMNNISNTPQMNGMPVLPNTHMNIKYGGNMLNSFN